MGIKINSLPFAREFEPKIKPKTDGALRNRLHFKEDCFNYQAQSVLFGS
jgi:hypothetical protein